MIFILGITFSIAESTLPSLPLLDTDMRPKLRRDVLASMNNSTLCNMM